MAQVLKRTFDQGNLVHEEMVDVPDPVPTPEEVAAAQLAAIDARLKAVKDALAESANSAIREVATRIAAKEAAITPTPSRVP